MTERDDAAAVYRFLRDVGPADAVTLAMKLFPWPMTHDIPESTMKALRKKSVKRVLEAITFMRGQGVDIAVSPRPGELSIVTLIRSQPRDSMEDKVS